MTRRRFTLQMVGVRVHTHHCDLCDVDWRCGDPACQGDCTQTCDECQGAGHHCCECGHDVDLHWSSSDEDIEGNPIRCCYEVTCDSCGAMRGYLDIYDGRGPLRASWGDDIGDVVGLQQAYAAGNTIRAATLFSTSKVTVTRDPPPGDTGFHVVEWVDDGSNPPDDEPPKKGG